jgi:hypothetical protein
MSIDPVEQALANLESFDPSVRRHALVQLRSSQDERITLKVIPVLRDSEAENRRLAAEVLSKSNNLSAVQPLIDALYAQQEVDVRAAIIDALGELRDRAAVPALIDSLYDEVLEVRFAAAEALGLIGDPRAVVDLIQVMDNGDIELEAMTAMALYKIGTPEALASIQHLFDGDRFLHDPTRKPKPGDEMPSLEELGSLESVSYPDDDFRAIPADRLKELLEEQNEAGSADETMRHVPEDMLKQFLDDQTEPEVTRPSTSSVKADEQTAASPVQFSAYYPREIAANVWQPLRAYVFRAGAAAAVADDASKELGGLLSSYREVERPAQINIAEGALITATPRLDGFQFNPPSAQVAFYEDWQRFDFKLRAANAPLDQASNGQITFTVEGVIVAEIPMSIYLGSAGTSVSTAAAPTSVTRPIYQSIFCSYSHKDTQIVERVERAYKVLGMTFLRDVISLRSGQDWDAELLNLIDRADIFQLFWSSASSQSKAVRKEWEYALQRQRQRPQEAFIRPVFWETPMPPPAPELGAIHFAFEPDLNQA